MRSAEYVAQLRLQRLEAIQRTDFFDRLSQIFYHGNESVWIQLAYARLCTCATAEEKWTRFEDDVLRLAQLLSSDDEEGIDDEFDCLDVASDFVVLGPHTPTWRAASHTACAQALIGIVASMKQPLIQALSVEARPECLPSIDIMRAALNAAGDIEGCLMV